MKIDSWVAKAADDIDLLFGRQARRSAIAEIIAKHCPFKPDTAYIKLIPQEQGHVHDWAARAASYIAAGERRSSVHRLAAVITFFTQPLLELLNASKRSHAPLCPVTLWVLKHDAGCDDDECECEYAGEACTCGADEWNKKIDEVIS